MAFTQVDAHNVVPVWAASGKLEYSAKTFRGKVSKVMDEYLLEYPELPALMPWDGEQPVDVDWNTLIYRICRCGRVLAVNWVTISSGVYA